MVCFNISPVRNRRLGIRFQRRGASSLLNLGRSVGSVGSKRSVPIIVDEDGRGA